MPLWARLGAAAASEQVADAEGAAEGLESARDMAGDFADVLRGAVGRQAAAAGG